MAFIVSGRGGWSQHLGTDRRAAVVQVVFVKAYGALGRFKDGAAFRPSLRPVGLALSVWKVERIYPAASGTTRWPALPGLAAGTAPGCGGTLLALRLPARRGPHESGPRRQLADVS